MDQGIVTMNGVEISNPARTYDYWRRGLFDNRTKKICAPCTHLDNTYVSPVADPAPWYTSRRPASADFLGAQLVIATLSPVVARTVSRRPSGGGTPGPAQLTERTIGMQFLLHARNCKGMEYGLAWLTSVLSGDLCDPCAVGDLTYWQCCPDTAADTTPHRTMRNVVLTSGLTEGSPVASARCVLRSVNATLIAGEPYAYTDPTTCRATSTFSLAGIDDCIDFCATPLTWWSRVPAACCSVTPDGPDGWAAKVTLTAGSSEMDGVVIKVYDGECPATGDPIIEAPIGVLPAGSTLVFDATDHSATLTLTDGSVVSGHQYVADSTGLIGWLEGCDDACICVDYAPYLVATDATAQILVYDRET